MQAQRRAKNKQRAMTVVVLRKEDESWSECLFGMASKNPISRKFHLWLAFTTGVLKRLDFHKWKSQERGIEI